MKKVLSILAAIAAVATIISLVIQIWPEPEPRINVLVEERRVGALVIKAATDEGNPIVAGTVRIRPGTGSTQTISTQTNSAGELEITVDWLMSSFGDDPPEEWLPDSETIREYGVIPVYVEVSKEGYTSGDRLASIDVR